MKRREFLQLSAGGLAAALASHPAAAQGSYPDRAIKLVVPRAAGGVVDIIAREWGGKVKGLGTVYATTVVHPAEGKPFNVALVDCDEGFRLMSRVEDIAPEQVRIGQRVRFRVHQPGGDEAPYPVFAPAENA